VELVIVGWLGTVEGSGGRELCGVLWNLQLGRGDFQKFACEDLIAFSKGTT
jgi:hypothetical protein